MMSTTIDRTSKPTRRDGSTTGSRATLRKVLLACGIGSSGSYVVANIVGALRGAGYSSVNQSVSELTAIDAPSRSVALPLFGASDVLALAFGIGVLESAGRNRPLRVAGWLLVGSEPSTWCRRSRRCTNVRRWLPEEPRGPTKHTSPSSA
jgi:hypothetical protein